MRLFADRDNAEVRLEGGERVVSDFWLGGRDARDESRLAGIRVSDEAHIGKQLQLEPVDALFARAAHLMLTRSLMSAGGEVLVAPSAASALGDDDPFVGLGEVVDQFAGFEVVERSADRYLKDNGFAVEAGAIGAHAVLAALGLVLGVEAEVDEGVVALRGFHDDVAAASAVATGGSAPGNKLFAAKGHAAVAAVACFNSDFSFIDKHN